MDFVKEFASFWWQCILNGWGSGYGTFAAIEVALGIVLLALRAFGKKSPNEEGWPKKILILGFKLGLLVFCITTLFIAPFRQYRQANTDKVSEETKRTGLEKRVGEMEKKLSDANAFPARLEEILFSVPVPVASRNPERPHALEVVVQVTTEVSPLSVGFICDKPIAGDARLAGAVGYVQHSNEIAGKVPGYGDESFRFTLLAPAVTPRTPLIVRLSGKEPFKVLRPMRVANE